MEEDKKPLSESVEQPQKHDSAPATPSSLQDTSSAEQIAENDLALTKQAPAQASTFSERPPKRSKSRTTNIPPLMPEGYAYEREPQQPLRSSTDPLSPTTSSASEPQPKRSKRFTHPKGKVTHTRHISIPFKRIGKWMGIIVAIFVVVSAAYLGFDRWKHQPIEPANIAPMAADSDTITPLPTQPDTAVLNRLREESIRREDSIRHAKWIYWKRKRQAQKAAEEATQQEEANHTATQEHIDSTAH